MALLPAWAVDGGRVPASMARRQTFASTSGATGIILPADLRVVALPTPGAAVRVLPGSAVMVSRYPNVVGESYSVANDSALDVGVPATGSDGPATRYVILRVSDPQFGGQVPEAPLDAEYCSVELVSSITALAYPHVVLARIDQPASTATITPDMITDLRAVANPREKRVLRQMVLTSADAEVLNVGADQGEAWPNAATAYLDIPEWATEAQIRCDWGSVMAPAGNSWGLVWVEFGPYLGSSRWTYTTARRRYDTPNAAGNSRMNFAIAQTVAIPEAIRGTNQRFVPKGRVDGGQTASRVRVDWASFVAIDVTFLEVPVGS